MRIARFLAAIASSLTLTLGVVFGLLTFPTTCACGLQRPHPHALFLMGHHHHLASGENPPSSDPDPDPPSAAADTGLRGPAVTTVSDDEYGMPYSVVLTGAAALLPVAPTWIFGSDSRKPNGRQEFPDVPPPRRGLRLSVAMLG